ncbi:extracellular solute-binding protein [Candidatus Avelusimicrobium aviculae]|uniref:extracellular solute-binding protein n=1 Tax=Candidatus Avelusimicrobium aviculae TaxID=3416206 RepID=UPI003D0BF648
MIIWVMPDSGSRTKEDYARLSALFQKEYPGVDITVRVFTRNILWRKIFTIKNPTPEEEIPDVIQIPHYWTALLTRAGVAENLSKLDPGLSLNNALFPLKPHCYLPGTKDIYSYPWWFDMSALHYRGDHLKLVSSNPEEDLSTWEGLLRICEALKQNFKDNPGYYPMQNSDWRGSLSVRSALCAIWDRGTDLITPDFKQSLVHTEQFKAGIKDYVTLALKNYMPILRERGSLGTMISGKASILMSRKQGVASFDTKRGVRVKTVPVPTTGSVYYSYLSGMNLMINVLSKEKENALAFIKWCARADNQIRYAGMMEVFPAFEDSFEQFIFSSARRLQTYGSILASAKTLPNITVTGTVIEILNKILAVSATQIVEERFTMASLDRELDNASKEIDYLLSLYEG